MENKTILITGGAGYIGSHAVKLCLQRGFRVVVFDNFSRGFRQPLGILQPLGDLIVVEGDLRNRDSIEKSFRDYPIDVVMHFAALCLPFESMEIPEQYFEHNVVGSLNLFEAMRKTGIHRAIVTSTCATYGDAEYVPVDEFHPLKPVSPYGESKVLMERMLRWYGEIHGFHYALFRYFNVCGADSEGLIGDHDKALLMQNAVRGALGIKPFTYTCPEVDTPDGTPIRDYIDVEDLAEAHLAAVPYLEKGGTSDVFNLGNGRGWSVKEMVDAVALYCRVVIPRVQGELRKGEPARIFANPEKAFQVLGWKPKKSLEQSIASLVRWYQKFPKGYEY